MDKGTELTVRGRTRTVEEWAGLGGMTVETLVWRLELGWEAQDAVLVPVRPAATLAAVTAFGRTLTPGEWEQKNGVPAGLIGKRIKLGWRPEDAVSRPVRPKRAAKAVTVGGAVLPGADRGGGGADRGGPLAEEKPGRAAQAVHSGFFVSAADRGGAGPSRC